MRHCGRAHLALDGARAQVTEADIPPDVTAEVDEHGVVAYRGLGVFGDPVMRFDLRRVDGVLEAERGDEARTDIGPVEIGVCNCVSVEVTNGAVELAKNGNGCESTGLSLESCNEVGEFLPECCR